MNIQGYEIPDILGNVEELRVIYEVTLRAVERLRAALAAGQRELDIETASEDGLARLEAIYGLRAEGYTLDERRFRLRCWTEDGDITYSASNIKDWIERFGGEGTTVTYNFSASPKTCVVRIPLSSEKKTEDLRKKLEKMLPVGTSVDVSAVYETFGAFSAQTWSELSSSTFNELKRGD